MQVPFLLGKSRTRLIQGMVIGAVASMVIGFSWGRVGTGATANKLAADQAGAAVGRPHADLRGEIHAERRCARKSGGPAKNHFQRQQGQYLEKGGWATRPEATSSDYELARACAAKLIEAKAASQ